MPIYVGAATSTVFKATIVGIGTTDTTGMKAGVGTNLGTLCFDASTQNLMCYSHDGTVNKWEVVGGQS